MAIGRLAIGRLAIGRLALKRARGGEVVLDSLEVGRLKVGELVVERRADRPSEPPSTHGKTGQSASSIDGVHGETDQGGPDGVRRERHPQC